MRHIEDRVLTVPDYRRYYFMVTMIMLCFLFYYTLHFKVLIGSADNFTDIFYTNSFRGAFSWFKKLDWIGMLVQMVISVFSLFGVALLVIRIMTSMLYLSSKGMWEEVHDLKSSGGESEKDFLGLFGMAKSWAKGKSGTGFDAIIGAVLMLLPDVKKYSDFGEKSKGDFSEDITISQYMLKIALPTVMTVFFFAMGFNGTLFQALAVTVDAMGTVADKVVSVNYSAFIDDITTASSNYEFTLDADGTNLGKLKQSIAKDVYKLAVRQIPNADTQQLYSIGSRIETWVNDSVTYDVIAGGRLDPRVKEALGASGDDAGRDQYAAFVGYNPRVSGIQSEGDGVISIGLGVENDGVLSNLGDELVATTANQTKYVNIWFVSSGDFTGDFFNLG